MFVSIVHFHVRYIFAQKVSFRGPVCICLLSRFRAKAETGTVGIPRTSCSQQFPLPLWTPARSRSRVKVTLQDLSGRIIASGIDTERAQVDMTAFPAGTYLFSLEGEKTEQIIRQ